MPEYIVMRGLDGNDLRCYGDAGMSSSDDCRIRIITHNIRYATREQGLGELPWSDRLPLLLAQLRFIIQYPVNTLVCLQEVLHTQLQDIVNGLNKVNPAEWTYIGVGRDDGREAGEYSPILFRKSCFECLEAKTTWLSPTPDIPSKGWDASSIRIVTHGTFSLRSTEQKRKFRVMSTHLDNDGASSRSHAADILLKLVRAERMKWPLVLAGDFNSPPDDEAYLKVVRSGILSDIKSMAMDCYGETMTYTGFSDADKASRARIDFIFVGPNPVHEPSNGEVHSLTQPQSPLQSDTCSTPQTKPWHVSSYAVLNNRNEDDGKYISDHRAVIGDLTLL